VSITGLPASVDQYIQVGIFRPPPAPPVISLKKKVCWSQVAIHVGWPIHPSSYRTVMLYFVITCMVVFVIIAGVMIGLHGSVCSVWSSSYTPRVCNMCAHELARSGLDRDPDRPNIWFDPLSDFVTRLVGRDSAVPTDE